MRTAFALLLSFASFSCAQERKTEERTDEKKRLSSVTWDLKSHKLVWEVQSGREVDGEFRANSSARYEISPDDAVMAVSTERRAFTQAEATQLHRLLDTLSLYCAESVVWWNQGQGRKLEENEQPDKRKHHSPGGDPERHKVDNPAPKPAPSNKAELVAIADQRR